MHILNWVTSNLCGPSADRWIRMKGVKEFAGFFVLIWVTSNYSLSESILSLAVGSAISIVAIWVMAKGVLRQRLRITEDGFVPFWRSFLSSGPGGQTLIPWSEVLFVAQLRREGASSRLPIWVDIILLKKGKKIVAYVVNPLSMVRYDMSAMKKVREASGRAFKIFGFKSFSSFQSFLKEQGIRPEYVDYKSGEFEIPIVPT